MAENVYKLKTLTVKVTVDLILQDILQGQDYLNYSDLNLHLDDTLTINVENETIEYLRNKYEGNQIKLQCHFERAVKNCFGEINARELFCEFPDKPDDIIYSEDVLAAYEIIIEAENTPRRVIKGRYCMEDLPKDYPQIIHKVAQIIDHIELWGEIFNPGIYARPSKRKSDVIYCGVEFGENSSMYHYITDDDSIDVGDAVIVPVGKNNREVKAFVTEKQYCNKDDVPYPLSKVKKIIRKTDDDDEFDIIYKFSATVKKVNEFVGKRIKVILTDYTSVIGIMNNFEYDNEGEYLWFYVQTDSENVFIDGDDLKRIEIKEE